MKSLLCAFALFSRIPLPRALTAPELRAENARWLMPAFPVVGVVIGAAALAWAYACDALAFGGFLRGAGCALLPLILTGGIHMDGLCDTADALASRGDPATKQRILRDPHAGAFAAMAAAAYLLAFAALAGEGFASCSLLLCFAISFTLSRSLTGLAVLRFPASPQSGMVNFFRDSAATSPCVLLLRLWLAASAAALLCLGGAAGAISFAAPLVFFLYWRRVAAQEFGGMSGDLSGCLLHVSELLSLAALVIVPKIVEKI